VKRNNLWGWQHLLAWLGFVKPAELTLVAKSSFTYFGSTSSANSWMPSWISFWILASMWRVHSMACVHETLNPLFLSLLSVKRLAQVAEAWGTSSEMAVDLTGWYVRIHVSCQGSTLNFQSVDGTDSKQLGVWLGQCTHLVPTKNGTQLPQYLKKSWSFLDIKGLKVYLHLGAYILKCWMLRCHMSPVSRML